MCIPDPSQTAVCRYSTAREFAARHNRNSPSLAVPEDNSRNSSRWSSDGTSPSGRIAVKSGCELLLSGNENSPSATQPQRWTGTGGPLPPTPTPTHSCRCITAPPPSGGQPRATLYCATSWAVLVSACGRETGAGDGSEGAELHGTLTHNFTLQQRIHAI